MSRSVRAWQGEDGVWVVWGTHNASEAEEACYRHLVDDAKLIDDDDEMWDLMPSYSTLRDDKATRTLWADRDLVNLDGTWPDWKYSKRWRPLRVRVMVVAP